MYQLLTNAKQDKKKEHHDMPMEREVPTTGGIRHYERNKGFNTFY